MYFMSFMYKILIQISIHLHVYIFYAHDALQCKLLQSANETAAQALGASSMSFT